MGKARTVCDYDCLHCTLSDCRRSTRDVSSQPKKRRSNAELKQHYGADSITYAALRHIPEPDYTVGLATKTMDKAELEKMLAAQYGRKLEPVTGSRRRQDPRAK
jgi:hypothetical protein